MRLPTLAAMAAFSLLAAVSALAADGGAPMADQQITIKGPLLSAFHFKGRKLDGPLVVYAFDGPPDVNATLNEVLDKYLVKVGDLDQDHAIQLQNQFDDKLRYYVDTNDPTIKSSRGYKCDFPAWLADVTGTLQIKNGQKWIMNAKIIQEDGKNPSFEYPPKAMLAPDKPFVMPSEKPIELKITDALSLKCVPIPPGKFLMGTPFYQFPRYQDECPSRVTLTKLYYMSEIPITQEIWEAVMGADKNFSDNIGPQLPVEFAPFPDIRQFCKILSEKNGRTVRLPTAAEMEYAVRMGTSNPEFAQKNKDDWVLIGPPLIWKLQAATVKTKNPNAWGLYDCYTEAKYAVSDWKAYNTPEDKVDPQGAPLEQSISSPSVLKPKKPVENMIMHGGHPAIHKGVLGGGRNARAGSQDRYTEDGCDGINGNQWIGIFRIVVESGSPPATLPGADSK